MVWYSDKICMLYIVLVLGETGWSIVCYLNGMRIYDMRWPMIVHVHVMWSCLRSLCVDDVVRFNVFVWYGEGPWKGDLTNGIPCGGSPSRDFRTRWKPRYAIVLILKMVFESNYLGKELVMTLLNSTKLFEGLVRIPFDYYTAFKRPKRKIHDSL